MSAFVLKLLDEAILPAVLVFCAKVGGLILLARAFNVSFTLESNRLVFGNLTGLVLANNLSNLFLLLVLLLGTGWVLLRLHFFHDSHLSPHLLPKILEHDLEFTISTSFNLFHQAFVWLSLGALVVFSLTFQTLVGLTSPIIVAIGLVQGIFLAVLVLVDFEREVKIEKSDQPSLWITETDQIVM